MRLTHSWQKVLYVAGYSFFFIGLGELLRKVGVDTGNPIITVLWQVATTAGIYYATRIFRGMGEPVAPRRVWWRMTAKPRAGYALGVLFAVSGAWVIVDFFLPQGVVHFTVVELVISSVANGVLAWLYISSSNRIRRERVHPSGIERTA